MSSDRQNSGDNIGRGAPTQPSPRRILVLILHVDGERELAERLTALWRPAVPAAAMSLIRAPMNDRDSIRREIVTRQLEAHVNTRSIILVGLRGTEALALALAFGAPSPICAALLIVGGTLPDPAPNLRLVRTRRVHCRLVLDGDDERRHPEQLDDLLHGLQSAGVNIRGAVFNTKPEQSTDPLRALSEMSGYAPAVMRMGGSYLAELVAIALAAENWAIALSCWRWAIERAKSVLQRLLLLINVRPKHDEPARNRGRPSESPCLIGIVGALPKDKQTRLR
jgi:hypothetical protein